MKHITTLLPITSILSIALLAGCTTTQTANTNEVAEVAQNTNSESNTNQVENTNEAVEVAENTNSDETNTAEVDTSDWLTYTNEEYGFSFKYPEEWEINGPVGQSIGVQAEKISSLPTEQKVAPRTKVSPTTKSQNEVERDNLISERDSSYGGKLIQLSNVNFYRYIDYIENGTIDIEYVTYKDDVKITLRYLEGDNEDFVDALSMLDRESLLQQYVNDTIENDKMRLRYKTLKNIINTFQG